MDYKELLIKILKDNVNLEGIVFALLDDVIEKALQEAVSKSENKIDDMVMVIYPTLESEIKKLISEKLSELYK